jgi:hypothetical protein
MSMALSSLKRVEPKSLLVLGNAKSLAPYPFDKYNVDTIGMSQAFRYWDKINWYPTYYICLDKEINRTFAHDIKILIKNRKVNKIKRFFLSKEILKKYPKFAKLNYVHFVEDLNQPGTKGFSGDTQVTTGSFAVRFGIWLGYSKIYILGIDSKYTPVDPLWVKKVTDKNQRLIVDINPDPDYFFDQYRQKGDHLHVPPPERMKVRTNHLTTFKKIHRDFNQRRHKVINCNKVSELYKQKILPYQSIPSTWLSSPPSPPSLPLPSPQSPIIFTLPTEPISESAEVTLESIESISETAEPTLESAEPTLESCECEMNDEKSDDNDLINEELEELDDNLSNSDEEQE